MWSLIVALTDPRGETKAGAIGALDHSFFSPPNDATAAIRSVNPMHAAGLTEHLILGGCVN
jgi:hypothetical protein